MPTYLYSDGKHSREMVHSMMDSPLVLCPLCSAKMHRVPQVPAVNWNGLPPHLEGTRSAVVQNFIDSAPERRAKYLETKGSKENG